MNVFLKTSIQVIAIIAWWEVLGIVMKRLRKRFQGLPFYMIGFEKVGEEKVIWTWRMK